MSSSAGSHIDALANPSKAAVIVGASEIPASCRLGPSRSCAGGLRAALVELGADPDTLSL